MQKECTERMQNGSDRVYPSSDEPFDGPDARFVP